MGYETLVVDHTDPVALIRLNRPQALNALNGQLMDELTAALDQAEADDAIRVIVLTGSDRAFAAGADIKEMASKDYAQVLREDFISRNWERVTRCRKPLGTSARADRQAKGSGHEHAGGGGQCEQRAEADEDLADQRALVPGRGLLAGGGHHRRRARLRVGCGDRRRLRGGSVLLQGAVDVVELVGRDHLVFGT